MARRGVMTALQAALAGIGGAAGGYVQMEETKRKRQLEDEARKRQEMRDIVELGDRDFVTGEQLAKQQEQGRRTTGSVVHRPRRTSAPRRKRWPRRVERPSAS
jgi:hypothetical protein